MRFPLSWSELEAILEMGRTSSWVSPETMLKIGRVERRLRKHPTASSVTVELASWQAVELRDAFQHLYDEYGYSTDLDTANALDRYIRRGS